MNAQPRTGPGSWGARVLVLNDPGDLADEMTRAGAVAIPEAFAANASVRLVKLDAVAARTAETVERAMRAAGGDAAAGRDPDQTGCLLIGTLAQHRDLCARLAQAGPDLAQVGAEIERALSAFDDPLAIELRCGEHVLPIGERTLVMGIINATPDSFSGDGLAGDAGAMVARGEQMVEQGADILDIGGESTRPGSEATDARAEMERVLPVIRELRGRVNIPISIDTYKAEVARAALDAGAGIINDISGLRSDPGMARLAAERHVPVIVMHMLGTPKTMQDDPRYDDLMGEIAAYLRESVALAERAGVPGDQVVIDPGFGFGKTVQHNLETVRRLRELKSLGHPVLLGPSRKSTIGNVLDLPPDERLEGTLAVLALAVANGADIVRVHDVRPALRAVRMADALVRGWAGA